MSIDNRKFDAVRELRTSEVAQVSGGCQMGSSCNCPGATYETNPNGSFTTNACDGSIWVVPANRAALLTA